jgi:hypothetical protein
MKTNPGKIKAVRFMAARVDPLNYIFGDQRIPEASNCKYLGINLSSHLIWADQVNYIVQKAWTALEFIMRVLKQGNSKEKFSLHVASVSDS